MPGLSGRMSTVIKAKVSHLLDRAEDPAETPDYSYERSSLSSCRMWLSMDDRR